MVLEILRDYVLNVLHGKELERHHAYESSLRWLQFLVVREDQEIRINGCAIREGVMWPDYPCAGDAYRDKFCFNITSKGRRKQDLVQLTKDISYRKSYCYSPIEFTDITQVNLELHFGQFAELY